MKDMNDESMPGSNYQSLGEVPGAREMILSIEMALSHLLDEKTQNMEKKFVVLPATEGNPPVFGGDFYWANLGTLEEPLMLQLRFEPINLDASVLTGEAGGHFPEDNRVRICLLMTNERHQSQLEVIGRQIYERVKERGIEFEGVIAPESLGSKLAQEVARAARLDGKPEPVLLSFQKGKVKEENGSILVGPPKEWVDQQAGAEVKSGTSHPAAQQKLYLDQKIASAVHKRGTKFLIVDDARLSQGTINSSIELLKKFGIPIAGIATVLNEGNPTDQLEGIPFVWLTKLPLMQRVPGGLMPIRSTFEGLDYFYRELPHIR
jgi:adenine/guanine phosphoribosyltransferase-like PRPP-binding protein